MNLASKLRTNIAIKPRLSATLKNWLPILQSGAGEIEEVLNSFVEENPYVEIQSKRTQSFSKKTSSLKTSVSDKIESLSVNNEDLYEKLLDQITSSLFPTKTSQKIAQCVIENINEDGFLDCDIALLADEIGVSVEEFERVRKRFFMLEPCGVGAKDSKEAFFFQLQESDLNDAQYELGVQIIENLSNHSAYKKNPHYEKVMQTIKLFKNPPTGEFSAKIPEIIPDIFIFERLKEDSLTPTYELEVRINDAYYPNIIIEGLSKENLSKNQKDAQESKKALQDSQALLEAQKQAQDFTKTKIKEAKDLVDALDMRKATILKIALSLRENQYNFFMGGEITPMKLKDIAQDLGYAPSTISRAIANKYLECDRGIFPIKSFFTAAIDGDTSNASIKDFILGLVKSEDKKKPLSDLKILKNVEEKFNIKMVRRTITKYRQQLNIASSSERKKLYEMSM